MIVGLVFLAAGLIVCAQIIADLRQHERWDAEDLADREAWAALVNVSWLPLPADEPPLP